MTFGNRLKKLRQSYNMTQQDLSKAIRLSKANVSKYESDQIQPSMETIVLISELFHVSIDYLLGKPEIKQIAKPGESIDLNADQRGEALKVALFGGDTEVTDEMWNEVMSYAEFIKQKYGKN